ncbi:hypothetical protein ACYQR9_03990 [Methylobacterium sp. CM6241]
MTNSLFSTFVSLLRTITTTELEGEIARPQRLRIETGGSQGKTLDVAYALVAPRRSLQNGSTETEVEEDVKVFGSFSGPMRMNLVAMLDSIGLNRSLGIATAGSLWAGNAHRVHFTSIPRYPVFVDGANYAGAPSTIATQLLRTHLMKWFGEEMRALPNPVFVPLGPVASEAIEMVAAQVKLDRRQVLAGLPNPSGANAERIASFLGRKRRQELSSKVNPEKLLAARASLTDKVFRLHEAAR